MLTVNNSYFTSFREARLASVNCFNKEDWKGSLNRFVIEHLCEMLVYDAFDRNGNEQDAIDILSGSKQFLEDASKNIIIDPNPAAKIPEGQFLAYDTLKKSIKYNSSNMGLDSRSIRSLEAAADLLSIAHGLTSDLGSHDKNYLDRDKKLQAETYMAIINSALDTLHLVCPNVQKIIASVGFPQIDIDGITRRERQIRAELDTLYNQTACFTTDGGGKFIILLPREMNRAIDPTLLSSFWRIKGALVVDLGVRDGRDLSSLIAKEEWDSWVNIVNRDEPKDMMRQRINWCFINGVENLGRGVVASTDSLTTKQWKQVLDVFALYNKSQSVGDYYVLDFSDDIRYSKKIYEKLLESFEDSDTAVERCFYFGFSDDSVCKEKLQSWVSDEREVNGKVLSIGLDMFLCELSARNNRAYIPTKEQHNPIQFSDDDLRKYAEYGISIFGVEKSFQGERTPFYKGTDISYEELSNNDDVRRDVYEVFKKDVKSLIESPVESKFDYYLKYNPGAGATTMCRRLAFDISLLNRGSRFYCLPVFVGKDGFDMSETSNYLAINLAQNALGGNPIVVFVDEDAIGTSNVDFMERTIKKAHKNITFVRCMRKIGELESVSGDNCTILSSLLSKEEAIRFNTAYKRMCPL